MMGITRIARASAGRWQERLVLLLQLLATAAVLGWVPDNLAKLATMLVIWAIGFRRVSFAEILVMGGVNLFFVVMNTAALARGVFRFDRPDFLGMPVYEYLMWGFYTLHTIRMVGGNPTSYKRVAAVMMAVVFALPFAAIADPTTLWFAASAALAVCFIVFHEPMDWAYAIYMAALGALIEHVGVGTGQWHYPGHPYGGIPPWSVTMWAGIGLFTRRLLLPMVDRANREAAVQPQARR